MSQMEGCLIEIKNNPLFGKGYGWTGYYEKNFGDHPIMLAFESLAYVVLCNSGFVGVIIWIVFIAMYLKKAKLFLKNKDLCNSAITLMVYYVAYSMITGEYGYMKFLVLFYTFILLEGKQGRKEILSKNKM